MRVKIVVNALEGDPGKPGCVRHSSEVWNGEMDVAQGLYVTKISIIAEGMAHPICDVPFSLTEGHWMWIPSDIDPEDETERIGGIGFDQSGKEVRT